MTDTTTNRPSPLSSSTTAGRAVDTADAPSPANAGSRARARPQPTASLLEILGTRGLVQAALLAAAFSFVYWDHFIRLFRYWVENPDWSHGFLIPVFCIYFVNSRRAELAAAPIRPSWLGLPVLLTALVCYFSAIYLKYGYPQPLSMVIAIAGIVILCCGWRVFWITCFAIGFLILAMPPPERLYRQVTQPLQQAAAFAAEHVLALLPNVVIERYGINIVFDRIGAKSGSFTVAGACSGMRSLMAFIALGLAMAYFSPRPFWHRLVLAIIVAPVAVFCNMIRVVITGIFTIYDYGNLAVGTPHAALGILTFALGFVIYYSFIYIMDHLFEEDDVAPEAEGVAT